MIRKLTIAAGIAVLLLLVAAGWQIGASVLANVELQDDMNDIASQFGTRIGYSKRLSDEELRDWVLRKSQKYKIELTPDQITVVRTGSGDETKIYLAVYYESTIRLPGYSFTLHFSSKSGPRPE